MSSEFKSYSSEELEKLIKTYPLSREGCDNIFNNIIGFEFRRKVAGKGMLFQTKDGKFHIVVCNGDPIDEQKKTVIHEFLHIKYKAKGSEYVERNTLKEEIEAGVERKSIEDLLETETERIYNNHPDLAEYVFERAKSF